MAEAKDIPNLAELYGQHLLSRCFEPSLLRPIIDSDNYAVAVAALDGIIASSATCYLAYAGSEKFGMLENVVTHPSYRRMGLAKEASLFAMKHIVSKGATHMQVMPNSMNEGLLAFYRGLGFHDRLGAYLRAELSAIPFA